MHIFFGQFKDYNSGKKHGNQRNSPIFSSTFSALTVCKIHFYIWQWSKFIFMWSPFNLFWSVKYLNFGQKLPIRTAHHTFIESRHPKITKNPYYVFSPKGAKKMYQVMGSYRCAEVSVSTISKSIPPFFAAPTFLYSYGLLRRLSLQNLS